jgi:tetratricopeptide (TPR) repeat protein
MLVSDHLLSRPEDRLEEAVLLYLKARDDEHPLAPEHLLGQYPDLASQLRSFFADQDRLEPLLAPLRAGARPAAAVYPRTFGKYELLEEIGCGGMGVVYKARQHGLDRLVALKMILGGRWASELDLKRFQREVEAAANLDHPHIVPVHEVGEEDGRQYFSMKLIDGGGLDQQLAHYGGDPQAAARLVAAVARAVHHAHERGILHRDLKPSNILLDAAGQPHVTDFGLARRVEVDSTLTQSGALVGTPSYMAPEQTSGVRGAITTATDVYGLGALLYTLLCGRPPFQGDSVLETLEQVRTREPQPPSVSNPQISRDLQTICLKCLRKEASERYASAEELADDLERWLAGKPITARPPTMWERAAKWTRRHSAAVAASMGVLMVMVIGLAAALIVIARTRDVAREQRRIALGKSREADSERRRAEQRAKQAREAVDTMYTQVAEKWLKQQPQLEPVQRDFLLRALAFYEELAREPGAEAGIRREIANAYRRVGDIHTRLGQHSAAVPAFRQALASAKRLAAEFPEVSEYQSDLAEVQASLADLHRSTGLMEEALAGYREAQELRAKLAASQPATAGYRKDLAATHLSLGDLLTVMGRFVDAEPELRRALEINDRLAAEIADDPAYRRFAADGHVKLGRLLHRSGRIEEAEAATRKALALAEALYADFPNVPEYRQGLATSLNALTAIMDVKGQAKESVAYLRRSLTIFVRLAADFPKVPEYRYRVAVAHGNLGIELFRDGRPKEAEDDFRQSLKTSDRLIQDYPSVPEYREHHLVVLQNLALILAEDGRKKEAEQVELEVVEGREKLVTEFPGIPRYRWNLAMASSNLGFTLSATGQWGAAERAFRRAIETYEKLAADSPNDPDYQSGMSAALLGLGRFRLLRGEVTQSHSLFERAVSTARAAMRINPKHPEYPRDLRNAALLLSESLVRLGEHDCAVQAIDEMLGVAAELEPESLRAAPVLVRCAELAERDQHLPVGKRHALSLSRRQRAGGLIKAAIQHAGADAESRNRLAWVLTTITDEHLRDPAQAAAIASNAVKQSPRDGRYWLTLGIAHYRTGDWISTIRALEKAVEYGPILYEASTWSFLAMAHWQRGEKDEARRCYDRANAWLAKTQTTDEEMTRYRSEAATLLGLADNPKSNGKKEESSAKRSKP